MKITVRHTLDPDEVAAAYDALGSMTVEGPNDSQAEYEVAQAEVEFGPDGEITVTLEVERVEGMNCSREAVSDALLDSLGEPEFLGAGEVLA